MASVCARLGGLGVRVGQPIEGAPADDAEPRDRRFALDIVVSADSASTSARISVDDEALMTMQGGGSRL